MNSVQIVNYLVSLGANVNMQVHVCFIFLPSKLMIVTGILILVILCQKQFAVNTMKFEKSFEMHFVNDIDLHK